MNCLRRGRRYRSRPLLRRILTLCGRFLVISLFIGCGLVFKVVRTSSDLSEEHVFRSRHLLTVEWETCDFEIGHARNYSDRDTWRAPNEAYAWLALYVLAILVIFVAIAIVCDDFFVPSLEAISEKLELSEDVAGATFMAAGSSAPELFTSVAGVSVESDVGIGTIVGSAVFNLLVIIALTAALAGKVLQLDWRPLLRDSLCYALSVGFFTWFAWDGKFELHESIVLLILYILYIVLMKFNPQLMDFLAGLNRSKGGQIGPHETNVAQFVNSDVESVADPNAAGSPSAALHGQQGTPAGKLPPLKTSTSQLVEPGSRSQSHLLTPTTSQSKRFAHANKGRLSRSFINLSLGRSHHHHHQSSGLPRLSVSFPMLRDVCDDPKANRRSSIGFLHTHGPGDGIRLKSVAQQQVMREYRRRSDMGHQPAVTVVQVDANGNSHAIPAGSRRGSGTTKDPNDPAIDGEGDIDYDEPKMRPCPCLPAVSTEFPSYPEEGGVCSALKYALAWILFLISFPFLCMFTWTIPDCSKPHNRKYFLLSFTAAIVWIAILSFAMVTLVGRSGCILSVDKFTMGLVVVAIGTSVPDCLSSILVARDGFGDMAVSNAIGSNVFDINLGFGLPFLIRSLIDKFEPILLLTDHEQNLIDSGDLLIVPHVKFGFILLLILITALVIFAIMRFKLNSKVGVSFLFMYVAFVVYGYVQDLLCDYNC